MRNVQVSRLICLIVILERTPTGMTVPQMKACLEERGFDVSLRTLYRDTEALAEAGIPLFPDVTGDQGAQRWKYPHKTNLGKLAGIAPSKTSNDQTLRMAG